MTTATPVDLDDLISKSQAEISKLESESSKLALAAIRKTPGADKGFARCEGHLAVARRVLSQAQAATSALAFEQEAEAQALTAAEVKRLTSERESAEQALGKRLVQTEEQLQSLVNVVKVTLEAGEKAYNAAVALGIHSRSGATGDRIVARVNHALRLGTNLIDFDYSMSPSGREPLSGSAPAPRAAVDPSYVVPEPELESEPEAEPESSDDLRAEAIKRAARSHAKRPAGTLQGAVEAAGRLQAEAIKRAPAGTLRDAVEAVGR